MTDNTTAPADLLPCPFCGGRPVRYHDGDYVIACSSANQCGARPLVDGYTSDEAIAAWNRRAAATTPQPQASIQCVGCEGKPAPENDPCAVCGGSGKLFSMSAPQPDQYDAITPQPAIRIEPAKTISAMQEYCPCGAYAGEEHSRTDACYATPQPTTAEIAAQEVVESDGRRNGWYWTFWPHGDAGWSPALYSAKGWEPAHSSSTSYFTDEDMGMIGPFIPEPDSQSALPTTAALMADNARLMEQAEEDMRQLRLKDEDVAIILHNINRKRRDDQELTAHDVREVWDNIRLSGAPYRPLRARTALKGTGHE